MSSLSSPVLRKQMSDAYKKAFKDALKEQLKEQTPESVTWMSNLHRELIIRLCGYTKRSDIQDEIAEANDPEIFHQLVENGKYNAEELSKFVNYVYSWLKRFCAPVRDADIATSLERLNKMLSDSSLLLYDVVAEVISETHAVMDQMDKDLDHAMVEQFRKAVEKGAIKVKHVG